MHRSSISTIVLAAALACATPAAAQQQEWTAADEDRATIMRFLERDEVGGVAQEMGVDVQDVGRRVLRMNDADAARVASQVREAEEQMAAQTITVTVTTLILVLLVIILLVLIL